MIPICCCSRYYIKDFYFQTLDDISDVTKLHSFDLLIIFVLYDTIPPRRKTIESIFRNKIRKGLPSDVLLQKIFKDHNSVSIFDIEYFLLLLYKVID